MLPQIATEQLFVTDAGMETDLIFNRGIELPEFAAFVLIDDQDGRQALADYTTGFIEIAREHDAGLILDTPTWRANRAWGEKLGYSPAQLDEVNTRWVEVIRGIGGSGVVEGCIGPRGDGYVTGEQMSADEAAEYHAPQIASLAAAGADLVAAMTMNYAEEATGVAQAAEAADVPAVISFTVETDGRLASGQSLGDAIEQVEAKSGSAPAYYMVNCAHPTHFADVLEGDWLERIRGVRANASALSHAELDEADELDAGDPDDLAARYVGLKKRLPNMNVVGGCCGTDARHVEAIAAKFSTQ